MSINNEWSMPLKGEQVARKIVEVASDKQAEDIVLLDVRELCSFADYFVICSGSTQRQTSAIADEIDKTLHKKRAEATA